MERSLQRDALLVMGFMLLSAPGILSAASYNFQTIDKINTVAPPGAPNGDADFNQLLGINNTGTIAGYWGDGTVVANHGFTTVPPYGQTNFTPENVPGATQTQVIGINNSGTTVGFSTDTTGNTTGFVHTSAGFTTPIVNPNTPAAPATNQLLGVNDKGIAAGFYMNAAGNAQAYLFNISGNSFSPVTVPGATASTAAGVNNAGDIAGFAVIGGNTEGFYITPSKTTEFEVPGSTNTGFFGLNNNGLAVGFYVDAAGLTHGLVYNELTGSWSTVDDPNASSSTTPAFGVTGTTINGINDLGQLVGFYSDGTRVHGLLATPTPEPASLGFMGLGLALSFGAWRRLRRSNHE